MTRFFVRQSLVVASMCAALCVPLAVDARIPADNRLEFKVKRNGQQIGEHVIAFDRSGDALQVEISIDLKVKLAFVTVYNYEHSSKEVWRDGQLVSIRTTTDDNGDEQFVRADRQDSEIVVDSSSGERAIDTPVLPTSYWHKDMLGAARWLNTQNGEVVSSSIEELGIDTIEVAGETVEAERYRLRGDIDADLWYSQGEWVKLQFEAEDGSLIDYVRTNPLTTRTADS